MSILSCQESGVLRVGISLIQNTLRPKLSQRNVCLIVLIAFEYKNILIKNYKK